MNKFGKVCVAFTVVTGLVAALVASYKMGQHSALLRYLDDEYEDEEDDYDEYDFDDYDID